MIREAAPRQAVVPTINDQDTACLRVSYPMNEHECHIVLKMQAFPDPG
jgi:hypothetical protein